MMDTLFSTYMDWDFLDWVFSFGSLALVGLFLGLVGWAFGFIVDWFSYFLKRFTV